MPARKPTRLLELSGAFKKNPQRRRPPEPKPSGPLGEPTESLSELGKQCWREIAEHAPVGLLMSSDRFVVEVLARLLERLRKHGIGRTRPQMNAAELSLLILVLGKCGLNPVDRSKLGVPETPPAANPFTQFDRSSNGFRN